jgi:hypothetical protein
MIAAIGSLAVLAVGVPGSAGKAGRRRPQLVKAFQVAGSNGFVIDVFAVELPRQRYGRLVLYVYNGDSTSTYSTPMRRSRYGIRGDLGPYGRVSVRFHPRGARWVKSSCSPPWRAVTGYFAGKFEFHGEGGYTDFPARRVRVAPLDRGPDECVTTGGGFGRGPGVQLDVLSRYAETSIVENRPSAAVRVGVRAETQAGNIDIGKFLEVLAPSSAFSWSSDLSRATVHPPEPFSGEATYRDLGGQATRWQGNLKVDFPGWRPLPLTLGPSYTSFHHGYCRVSGLKPEDPDFDWCGN